MALQSVVRRMLTRRWRDRMAVRLQDPLADMRYGLLCPTFSVHVRLMTETIITLEINPRRMVHFLRDQIRQYQASYPLNWPSTCRISQPSSRVPNIAWDTPAALRLSFFGRDLDDAYTLAQYDIQPGSELSAHMYFSQHETLGGISHSEHTQRRVKHALDEVGMDQLPSDGKRQKFNEPLRNQHIHRMLNLGAGLETTSENAARYGLDVDEMEDLLEELNTVDGETDGCENEHGPSLRTQYH